MNYQEMRALKPGTRVLFSDGVGGVVLNTNQHSIEVEWADGQHGYIALEDGQHVARRCDCENAACHYGFDSNNRPLTHPAGDCEGVGTVKAVHGWLCAGCAEFMPAEYLEVAQ